MSASSETHEGARRIAAPLTPLARVASWHLVWTLAVLLGALGVNAAAGGLPLVFAVALAAGLVPGLYVMIMKPFDGQRARLALLALWAVAGVVAAALTGGMGGPLGAWCLAPLAVSGALGRRRSVGLAAGLSLLAVLAVVVLQLSGRVDAPPAGLTAFALGLTAALSLTLGFGIGFVLDHRRRQAEAEPAAQPEPGALSELADAHAGQIALIEPDNTVGALHGRLETGLVEGGDFTIIARADDREALATAAQRARDGAVSEAGFIPAGDLDRFLSIRLAPVEGGRLAALIVDATTSRDREESLEAAKVEAENLAAGKSRFLAGMSHELRTPLNAIMGFSDIMRSQMFGELPGKYKEYAELIYDSGAHLLDLVNDVLDMSKIEAQRFELNTEFMDAREPVTAALRIVRVSADEAGVKLRADLPPSPLEVDADRRAVKQIVLNLVSNAIKFTPKGGSVVVGLSGRGRELVLTVADTGVGIAPDDLARLGKPYEQVGDLGRRSQGTGLGLSLVRALAELHGGKMVIESRLGEGTAVTISMPVVEAESDGEEPRPDNVVAFNPQR